MNFGGKFAHLIPESKKYADCLLDVASNIIDTYQSTQDVRTFNNKFLVVPEYNNNTCSDISKCSSNSYLNLIPDKSLIRSKSMIFFNTGRL
uniref:Uncharacterized protein n=1 Tax=Parastrongyloides trichosuri TaxID=131310 RepID=A0A0N4ZGH9_PARTI